MSYQLRYYQEDAILALYDYFERKAGNPIVAIPTAGGKSIIIAEFLRSVYTYFPGQKILMLTHVKELISQNYEKLVKVWPSAPAGIYSAGLGKKEVRPITFAGIASIVKKAVLFGHVDMVIIDECHLVSPKQETSYQNFISDLMKVNPSLKVVGFTATPYRLGQGLLTEAVETRNGPRPPLFTDICYDITGLEAFNKLVAEGFLSKLVPKRTLQEVNIEKVRTTAGEYNLNDLQAAVDRIEITRKAIDEALAQALPENRVRWLVFGTGIEHAEHIAEELKARGIDSRCVHSKMPVKERDAAVAWFKAPCDGAQRALVNNGVFTTGFDCPEIDLIIMLRPTQSPSLWVQMLGRGTRVHPGKADCLVLDFAGNTKRLGPINDPVLPKRKGKGKGKGVAPVKVCEACGVYNHASVRHCVECGQEFPVAVKIKEHASSDELVRETAEIKVEIFEVELVSYAPHFPRNPEKPVSLKATYQCGLRQFSEWICLEHEGFAGKKARDWWRERMGEEPPDSVEEAMTRIDEAAYPSHIRVWLNARNPRVMDYDFSGTSFHTKPKNSGKPEKLDEDNPF